MAKAKQPIRAMGFFQSGDLAKAAAQALRFAGDGGRLGTMLDIVDARLATGIGSNAWERYWTTNSWEFRGRSRGGVELLAVHHGRGPLQLTHGPLQIPQFIAQAYEQSTREDVGARIPEKFFRDFLDGKFGSVATVELQPYLKRYRYPFLGTLTFDEALEDPVVRARLGTKAEALLRKHRKLASEFYAEREYEENDYLLQVESPSNCGYKYRKLPDDWAFAHALVIGQPMNMSHMPEEPGQRRRYWNSFTVELGCHERWNGVRTLGIRGSASLDGDIHPGIAELSGHLERNWRRLTQPVRGKRPRRDFVNLTRCGEHWFSQYPMGDGVMMTGEPEFRVVKKTKVSGPGTFRTEILGYYGLFKYEEKDVRALAPKGANAYHFGEPTIESHDGNPTHHVAPVQWFRVTLDMSERLPRQSELLGDVELQLKLLEAA